MQRVSVAEAKARFSELLTAVRERHERIVMQRHGKPVAALVSIKKLEELEARGREQAEPSHPEETAGARLLREMQGLFSEEEADELLRIIEEERRRPSPPPIDFDELESSDP